MKKIHLKQAKHDYRINLKKASIKKICKKKTSKTSPIKKYKTTQNKQEIILFIFLVKVYQQNINAIKLSNFCVKFFYLIF